MRKYDDIGGVWSTIGGRRVFIKDGQDLAAAMKESGKFKTNSKKQESIQKRIQELEKQKENAKGFLERAKIQNEITALENGFDNYNEYQNSKKDDIAKKSYLKDSSGNEYKVNDKQLNDFVKNYTIDINDYNNCDSKLQEKYAKEIGYDSKIQIVKKEDYEKNKGQEIIRFVSSENINSTKEIVNNSKIGDIRYSDEQHSYYGKGLYYGDKSIESKLAKEYGKNNGLAIHCKISDNAKIVEFNDISDYISGSNKLAKGIKDSSLQTFYNNPTKNRNMLFMNSGVDIIKIKRDNYYIILNRGVLITYDE